MAKPYGVGWSQDDMMKRDRCILLDNNDNMIGDASKVDTHIFDKKNPRGLLHRAFSVFLFDKKGKMLLQQRASDKITFPNVWTNTCCSHPLYGYEPSEVDDPESVAKGRVPGVINAAIRKLEHELGIPTDSIAPSQFKFLTRLHYWAADVVTHGKNSKWGEHEIDYILFVQVDKRPTMKANREEISDTRYVSKKELIEMMTPGNGLLWSPWFRIIAEKFLIPHWWDDLQTTMNTNKYVDHRTIFRFDPTTEHMGGGGNAGEWLGVIDDPYSASSRPTVGDVGSKQGAYGKVITHKHSRIDQLIRIDEIFAAFWYQFGGGIMPNKVDRNNADVAFCDDMLGKVSRSFAAVIRQLPKGLCLDIMVFYLALRALDTVEDDMMAFKGKEDVKIDHLNNFYKTALVTDNWSMSNVGEGDERRLLENYHRVVNVYKGLSAASQLVIADITKKMGQGMAYYVDKDLGQGTVTIKDYNKYCHFVAGLVGQGLSRLFTCSGYESKEVSDVSTTLANTMGLFLQKTNIIRDYLEDYVDGRAFWPQEVWKQYAVNGDLGDLAKEQNRTQAVQCLNHLITDALECIPECLDYMKLLKTEEVFRFCAIPQVMAIATLNELYDNPKVFTGVVKIRKCQAAKLILDTKSVSGLHKWFNIFAKQILSKVPKNDPTADRTMMICNKVISLTEQAAWQAITGSYAQVTNVLACSALVVSTHFVFGVDGRAQQFLSMISEGVTYDSMRRFFAGTSTLWKAVFSTSLTFIFSYSVIASSRERLIRAD